MYYLLLIALMLVLPIGSIAAEVAKVASADLPFLIAKWFVFWSVGMRFTIAGIRQLSNPTFTAKDIFSIDDPAATKIVVELGFATLCMGLAGLVVVSNRQVRSMGEREHDRLARVFFRQSEANGGAGGTAGSRILKQRNPAQRRLRIPRGPPAKEFAHENVALASFFERERPGQCCSWIGGSRLTVRALVQPDIRGTCGGTMCRPGSFPRIRSL